jgi:hypothetical protein
MGNTTDEKRWGFRAAVLAGTILPLLYVISIGPACRFCFDHHRSPEPLPVIYWPIWQLSRFSVTGRATAFYLSLWGSSWRAEYWDREHGVVIGGRTAKIIPDP